MSLLPTTRVVALMSGSSAGHKCGVFVMLALRVLLMIAFHDVFAEEAQLPSYIKPCSYDAADFERCVRRQLEGALPRFARGDGAPGTAAAPLDPLDPLALDDVAVDARGLRLALRSAAMRGLGAAAVHHLKVNLKEESFSLKFVANMSVSGAYSVAGRVLLLPILGDGNCTIHAQNTEVEISSKLRIEAGAGGEHLRLATPSYRYHIQRTTFRFDNLFNGNKQLSEAMHRFANENWEQLMEELAPPVIRQIVRTSVRAINRFFAAVQVQRLILGIDAHPRHRQS